MRITLLTLAILLGMSADAQVLLWVLVLLPGAGAMMFVGFLLRPAAKKKPQRDDRAWRGVHRERQAPGRHSPARGRRLQGVSRQAQLEERTVSVDRAALLGDRDRLTEDVARIYGVPKRFLEERTREWCTNHVPERDGSRLRCRSCRMDLPEPEGYPGVGKAGMWSWDGSTRLGPRPVRPRMAPKPPPPASGRGA